VRGDDPLDFAQQSDLIARFSQLLKPLLQIATGTRAQISSQLGYEPVQFRPDTVQFVGSLRR
jgi:hypothetical protein